MRQSQSTMEEIGEELICEIQNANEEEVIEILKKNVRLNLHEIIDERLFSTLHLTTFAENQSLTVILLKYAKEQQDKNFFDQNYLKNFLDMRNDEGFSAMHLASYRGNLPLVQLLENYGASIYIKNVTGLTPMHTAAQGDNPHILAYLREKRMDFDQVDSQGRSPLHWASYQGSEQSAIFLISWGANIQRKDTEIGMTPLHLAALSGSVRLTRKLLLRGAQREESDFSGKKALDIARENEYSTITKMLEKKNRFKQCVSMKQELRPPEKFVRQFWFFVLSQAICNIATIFFVAPYFENQIWLYIQIALLAIVMLFLMLSKTNPGYLKPVTKRQRILTILLKINDFDEFCADCEIVKPPRSRHCETCRYHHCPWIDNCVGAENFIYFFLFVVIVFIQIIFQLSLHAAHIYDLNVQPQSQFVKISDSKETLEFLHVLSSAIVVTLCGLFTVPLLMLLWVQIQNIFQGLTTNERFSRKKNRGSRQMSPAPSQQQGTTNSESVAGSEVNLGASSGSNAGLYSQGAQTDSGSDTGASFMLRTSSSNSSSENENRQSIVYGARQSTKKNTTAQINNKQSGQRVDGNGSPAPRNTAASTGNGSIIPLKKTKETSINSTNSKDSTSINISKESSNNSNSNNNNGNSNSKQASNNNLSPIGSGASINSQYGEDYDESDEKSVRQHSHRSRSSVSQSSIEANNRVPLMQESRQSADGRQPIARAQSYTQVVPGSGRNGSQFTFVQSSAPPQEEPKSRCDNILDICCRNATNVQYERVHIN